MFDYHTHSAFSADGSTSIEDMVSTALSMGMHEIAITDHLDLDYPSEEILFDLNFDKYIPAIEQVKRDFHGKIKVLTGVEMGLQLHVLDQCTEVAEAYPFDFILASFHCASKKELDVDYFDDKTPKEAYLDFYQQVYECLKQYKAYSVVGHFNVIDRYTEDIPPQNTYMELVDESFRMIIADGKGIEFNTSAFRYGNLDNFIEMLKLYKHRKGEIITLGSDAHAPRYLYASFQEAKEILSSIGFRYITTFEERIPSFKKLETI